MIAVSRAASSAAMSAADPTYRSLTSFGLPSTHAISRRYQYGFPLITFLYRLAIPLGHRRIRGRSQANTPKKPSSAHSLTEPQDIKVELAAKLGLGRQPLEGDLGAAQRLGGAGGGRDDLGVVVHVEEDLGHALLVEIVEVAADLVEGAG